MTRTRTTAAASDTAASLQAAMAFMHRAEALADGELGYAAQALHTTLGPSALRPTGVSSSPKAQTAAWDMLSAAAARTIGAELEQLLSTPAMQPASTAHQQQARDALAEVVYRHHSDCIALHLANRTHPPSSTEYRLAINALGRALLAVAVDAQAPTADDDANCAAAEEDLARHEQAVATATADLDDAIASLDSHRTQQLRRNIEQEIPPQIDEARSRLQRSRAAAAAASVVPADQISRVTAHTVRAAQTRLADAEQAVLDAAAEREAAARHLERAERHHSLTTDVARQVLDHHTTCAATAQHTDQQATANNMARFRKANGL